MGFTTKINTKVKKEVMIRKKLGESRRGKRER